MNNEPLEIKYDIEYTASWKHSTSLTIIADLHIITYAKSSADMQKVAVKHARDYFSQKHSYNGKGQITIDFNYISVNKDDR